MKNWLKLGDYNAICDSCGRKYKATTMKKRWDGLFVCPDDYEIRHPQLSLKVRGDKMVVPIPRPDQEPATFLAYLCSVNESNARADMASADCARVGFLTAIETYGESTLWIYEDTNSAIAGIAIAGLAVAGDGSSLQPEA